MTAAQLLDALLKESLALGVSDIHIDLHNSIVYGGDKVIVRVRLDGVLMPMPLWNSKLKSMGSPLFSRLKVVSKMDVTEKRLPQDGSFQIQTDNLTLLQYKKVIDIRVSIIPTSNGEKAVVRLLQNEVASSLVEIGMDSQQKGAMLKALQSVGGLILVTGPTGCGKTTTLYASLREINRESRSIVTIEDPVEYKIDSAAQIAIRKELGFGFASALKAVLRQDPDVVFLGEIRDLETAEIALRAALTGHLVLSTIHARDAKSTILRLLSMGLSQWLVDAALNLVVAQRLVRKICQKCLGKTLAKVCGNCQGIGYAGRVGIFEVLEFAENEKGKSLNQVGESLARQAKKLITQGVLDELECLRSLGQLFQQDIN